jgi:hypothetical protein
MRAFPFGYQASRSGLSSYRQEKQVLLSVVFSVIFLAAAVNCRCSPARAKVRAHEESGYEAERSFLYSLVPLPRPLGLRPESATVLATAGVRLANQLQQA